MAESDQPPAAASERAPRLDPAGVALWSILLVFLAVVVVRLGPSLLGWQTFSSVDLLPTQVPWNDYWLSTPPHNGYGGDTIDFFLPGYQEMYRRLWSGDLPWWSTLSGSGIGLFSSSVIPTLTPGSVVLLFAPTSWAIGMAKLMQLVLAFGGMMLWLRRIGTTWAAGALAGLFYCGSGFFVAWSGWVAQATVAATIPLLFWAVERFLAKRTAASALLISLVVAWLLLGGFPAVAGHALYAGGLYFLVRLFVLRSGLSGRELLLTLVGGAGAVALGGALAAVQFLPTVSGLLDMDLAWRRSQFNAVQPFRSLLTTVFPTIFNPTDTLPQLYRPSNPIEGYAYLGAGAVALAVLAILAGRNHRVARGVIPVLVIVGLLASALVWKHGFWTDWMRDLPVFSGNNSGRLRAMVALTGSALAGIGFNLLFRSDLPVSTRRRLRIGAWAMAVAVTMVTVVAVIHYGDIVDSGRLALDATMAVVSVVLVALLFTFAPGWPASTPVQRPPDQPRRVPQGRRITALLVAFAVFCGAQMLVSTAYFWPTSEVSDFYPETAGVDALRDITGDGRAVLDRGFTGSSAEAYGIRTVTGHNYQAPTWREVLMTLDPKAYTGTGRSPTNPRVDVDLTDGSLANPLYDRLSTTTVVTAPSTVVPGPILNVDGTAARPLPTTGDAVDVGASGIRAQGAFAAQSLRGFAVRIAEGTGDETNGIELSIQVHDRSGTVVATASAVRSRWVAGWTQIPMAGEGLDAAAGPLTATVSVHSQVDPNQQMPLGGSAAGVDLRLMGSQDDGLRLAYADSQIVVWQRLTALPRVRWASEAIVKEDTHERLTALVDPATPRSAVVLSAPGPVPSGSSADLSVVSQSGDEVTVDVTAAGSGYLVLADAIQSGWSVDIDGDPADLVAADHAFGAVFVPDGTHTVTFSYDAKSVRLGLSVSAAAVIVAMGLLGMAWYRRRRTPPGDSAASAGASDRAEASAGPSGMSASPRPHGRAG